MRISDWSSDVCSSDLPAAEAAAPQIDMPPLEDAVSVEASVVKTEPAKAPVDPDAATLAATLLIALGGHAPGAATAPGKPAPVEAETNATPDAAERSEEHTSELQSLMRRSYAVFSLKKQQPPHRQDAQTTDTGKYR